MVNLVISSEKTYAEAVLSTKASAKLHQAESFKRRPHTTRSCLTLRHGFLRIRTPSQSIAGGLRYHLTICQFVLRRSCARCRYQARYLGKAEAVSPPAFTAAAALTLRGLGASSGLGTDAQLRPTPSAGPARRPRARHARKQPRGPAPPAAPFPLPWPGGRGAITAAWPPSLLGSGGSDGGSSGEGRARPLRGRG